MNCNSLALPACRGMSRVLLIHAGQSSFKLDMWGYPKDGFRLMKTTRPPEYTPDEWAMMRNYYTEEEKAEVKGGGKKKKDGPKSKESEVSAPAEAQTLQMPGGKRIRAMLRNCWGGVEWQYNWGLQRRTYQRSRTHWMGNTWLSLIGSGSIPAWSAAAFLDGNRNF